MTLVDPFAAAPADEAQSAPPEAPVVAPSVPVEAPKPVAVKSAPKKASVPSEGNTQVRATFKGGAAYDAPWITVDAPDVQSALDLVSGENAALLADLMTRVQQAGNHFVSQAPVRAASQSVTVNTSAPSTAAPAGATGAPGGETRQCKHGEMQYRSGFSAKTNKTWQAFMCPTPKGAPDQCDAQWIR